MLRFIYSFSVLVVLVAFIGFIGRGFCSLVVTDGWGSAFFFLAFVPILMLVLLAVCFAPFSFLSDLFRRPRGD
jgi:hypothetical protein